MNVVIASATARKVSGNLVVRRAREVLASHYVAAFEAAPDAEDAPAVRAKAGSMLARAGARAGSLGAPDEGQRYSAQAAELADDALVAAALLEHAGRLAVQANRPGDTDQGRRNRHTRPNRSHADDERSSA